MLLHIMHVAVTFGLKSWSDLRLGFGLLVPMLKSSVKMSSSNTVDHVLSVFSGEIYKSSIIRVVLSE